MTTGYEGLDRWLKRWGLSLLLILGFVVGTAFVLVTYSKGPLPNPYFEHLFMALSVASFIGLFIELTLQRQLAKNVFEAALGYLLPDRLKTELRWVYNQQIIATQTYDVTIQHIEAERRVIFEGTYRRRIENISDRTVSYVIGGGVEEQFSKFGESEVLAWTMKKFDKYADDEKAAKLERIVPIPHLLGIGNKLEPQKIAPNEMVEVMLSYVLYLPDNGMEYLTYRCPLDRPSVTIKSPNSLKVELTFSHRDNESENLPIEAPITSHTLERVLLPHQDIKVSWRNLEDIRKRAVKHGIAE